MLGDFYPAKKRKRVPYSERVAQLLEIVNKKGRVAIYELIGLWLVERHYALKIVEIALARYSFLKYDEVTDEVVIPERAKAPQGTPGTSKEEGVSP